MSSWVGNPGRPPYVIPCESAGLKKNELSVRQVNGVDLVVLQRTRIVVPLPARKFVIRELHNAHSGLMKSIMTAQQLYYWPGMRSDIKSFIDAWFLVSRHGRPWLGKSCLLLNCLQTQYNPCAVSAWISSLLPDTIG